MLCVQKWREERDKLVGGLEQILQQKDARIASLEAQSRHARQVGGDEGAGQRGRGKLVGGLEQILQQKDARIASLEAQSRHARQVGGDEGAGQRGRGRGGAGQAGRGTGADTAAEGRSYRVAGGAVPSRQTGGRGRGGGAEVGGAEGGMAEGVGQAGRGTGADTAAEGRSHRIARGAVPSRQTGERGRGDGAEGAGQRGWGKLVGGLEQILQQKDARIASLEAQSRHARQVGGDMGAGQRGRGRGGHGRGGGTSWSGVWSRYCSRRTLASHRWRRSPVTPDRWAGTRGRGKAEWAEWGRGGGTQGAGHRGRWKVPILDSSHSYE